MKESYESIEMEIREISTEDVITVSGVSGDLLSAHDNSFIDWASFI